MAFTKEDPPTPASFEYWTRFASHRTTIWGVDRGVNDVFVAADGTNEDPHRYRKLSSKERWKLEEGDFWKQLFDDLPTVKTADCDQLLDALRYRLNNFAAIVEPFDRHFRYRRLAFSSYRNRQRGIHEACRRLTFGSKEYGLQCTPRHQPNFEEPAMTRNFWKPLSPLDHPIEDHLQHYFIAFGKTSFRNMRGKKSGPVKKIFQHLCYLSRVKHNISVIAMD
ncbi:hypothetical protein BGW37DRAFT_491137, partial [Umbelopsis sp. PMI_123]